MKSTNDFGKRLNGLMDEKGIETHQDLADHLDISRVSVTNYINGKSEPSKLILNKMKDFFQVKLEWLATGKGQRKEKTYTASIGDVPEMSEWVERVEFLKYNYFGGGRSQMGRAMGVSEGSVRNYEKGYKPQMDNIIALAETTGISVEWIVTGKAPPTAVQESVESFRKELLEQNIEDLRKHVESLSRENETYRSLLRTNNII